MAATIETLEKDHSAELRLDESRRELQHLFAPEDEDEARPKKFPRSKTMRLLTGGGGAALLALGAGGLILLRPGLLKTALRILPVNAMVRMLAVKLMTRGR